MNSNSKQLKKQKIEKNTLDDYKKLLSALQVKKLYVQANKPEN